MTVCPATVRVADRAAPLFALAVTNTKPLPDPLAGAVMLIQGAVLLVVHGQPPAAVTVTVRTSPEAATVLRVGETVYVQVGAGVVGGGVGDEPGGAGDPGVGGRGDGCVVDAWLMRTTWLAIATAPLRTGPGFGATSNRTEALPSPAAGLATIHSASLRTVHAHPSKVVSAMETCSPAPATSRLEGDTS